MRRWHSSARQTAGERGRRRRFATAVGNRVARTGAHRGFEPVVTNRSMAWTCASITVRSRVVHPVEVQAILRRRVQGLSDAERGVRCRCSTAAEGVVVPAGRGVVGSGRDDHCRTTHAGATLDLSRESRHEPVRRRLGLAPGPSPQNGHLTDVIVFRRHGSSGGPHLRSTGLAARGIGATGRATRWRSTRRTGVPRREVDVASGRADGRGKPSRPVPPPDGQRAGVQRRPRAAPPRLLRQGSTSCGASGAGLTVPPLHGERAGRDPLCPARADALNGNSAFPQWGRSERRLSGSTTRARSGPRGRECRRSADPEARHGRSRLPRRRSRPPVARGTSPPRARLSRTPDRQAWGSERTKSRHCIAAGLLSAGTDMADIDGMDTPGRRRP